MSGNQTRETTKNRLVNVARKNSSLLWKRARQSLVKRTSNLSKISEDTSPKISKDEKAIEKQNQKNQENRELIYGDVLNSAVQTQQQHYSNTSRT